VKILKLWIIKKFLEIQFISPGFSTKNHPSLFGFHVPMVPNPDEFRNIDSYVAATTTTTKKRRTKQEKFFTKKTKEKKNNTVYKKET
jgi:hypothetical protein